MDYEKNAIEILRIIGSNSGFTAAGIKAEIVMPKETMWQLIVRKKTPPTRLIRYCCSELKESYGAGKKMVTGVRKAESVNRAKNQGVVTFPKPHKNVREMVDDENFHLTGKGGGGHSQLRQ